MRDYDSEDDFGWRTSNVTIPYEAAQKMSVSDIKAKISSLESQKVDCERAIEEARRRGMNADTWERTQSEERNIPFLHFKINRIDQSISDLKRALRNK